MRDANGRFMKGHHPKTEFTSERLKKMWREPKYRELQIRKLKEHKLSDIHKRRIGMANKGNIPWTKGKPRKEDVKRKISEANKGQHHSVETEFQNLWGKREFREKITESMKKRWCDPEYVKRIMKSMHKKPNNKEMKLDEIIQKHFPNEWKYVGDGKDGTVIGGKIPDWINVNGKKRVIELFGEYWHSPLLNRKVKDRRMYNQTLKHYKKYGFDCLIFWSLELDEGVVAGKIKNWMV